MCSIPRRRAGCRDTWHQCCGRRHPNLTYMIYICRSPASRKHRFGATRSPLAVTPLIHWYDTLSVRHRRPTTDLASSSWRLVGQPGQITATRAPRRIGQLMVATGRMAKVVRGDGAHQTPESPDCITLPEPLDQKVFHQLQRTRNTAQLVARLAVVCAIPHACRYNYMPPEIMP